MSNALSAVLQGLESGSRMGLNIYTTLKDQGRADRREQFDRSRAARQDMESDRVYDRQIERDKVGDEQWGKTHGLAVDQHELAVTTAKNLRDYQQGVLGIQGRQQDLAEEKFGAERSDVAVKRSRQYVADWVTANERDGSGRLRTDQELWALAQQQGMGQSLGQAVAVGSGIITPERARGYESFEFRQFNDKGDGGVMVTGADGEGKPIQGGPKPMTVAGKADPNDPVLTGNIYSALGMFRSPETVKALGTQNQSDTLITMDTKDDLAAEEARIERERQQAGADVQSAEAEIAKAQAQLDELEANAPEPVSLLRSMPMSDSQRRALSRHPEVAEWEAKRTSLGDVINTKQGFIQQRTSDLSANETRSQQTVQTRLGQAQYDSVAFPQNYQERKDKKLTEQRDAYTKVKTDNRTTVVNAVKRANTHLEKTLGKKNPLYAEKRLDDNKVLAELERLPAEVQVALAKQPGGLDLMVSTMAESGLTSFNYLLDAMDKQVNMEDYYEVLRNPSVAEIAGRDPDKLHQLATTYAEHKAQNPSAPLEASVLAISRGKRPPTERSALSNINARDFVPALQLLDATKRSLQ